MEKKYSTKAELIKLIEKGHSVFVKFDTEWCGVCKINQPMLDSAISKLSPKKSQIVYIDADTEALWEEDGDNFFKVRIVPTYIAFKDGQQIWRAQNFVPEVKLIEVIKELEA